MNPTSNPQNEKSADKRISLLAARAEELRQDLRKRNVDILAENTLSKYIGHTDGSGHFSLYFWEDEITVTYPAFEIGITSTARPLNPGQEALILYYFFTANGTQPSGEWISFSNLQDGRFYAQAFQGYSGKELAKEFHNDKMRFEHAAGLLYGKPYPLGDAAFEFVVLPKVHLLVVFWQGDDDFPPNYQILFDSFVNNYLPTDACAIAGSMLTRKLISSSR